MYDSPLIQCCMNDQPRINPDIAMGLGYSQYSNRRGVETCFEEYIDTVLRCAAESFPEGLKYVGYRRATPEEQFLEATRSQRSKRSVELATSDLYYCRYEFTFQGKRLMKDRYLQLPYLRPGSVFRIRGATFTVSPVLADNILSIETNQIYMPVTRSKITFRSTHASFLANGEVISDDVVYGNIFKDTKNANTKRHAVLVHYVLCKYGLGHTFRHYCGADVVVGHQEITPETHPPEEWVICQSRGLPPRHMRNYQYSPATLRIAIPRDRFTATAIRTLAAVFYIVDHEPELVEAEEVNNTMLWRRLLPRFLKNEVSSERKAMEEVQAHIESVDSYLDELVRRRLAHDDIPRNNIYDVLMYIVDNYMELTAKAQPANSLDKLMEVTRFFLFDIVSQISRLLFELVKMTGNRLNYIRVKEKFDKLFRPNKIHQVNSGHGSSQVTHQPRLL